MFSRDADATDVEARWGNRACVRHERQARFISFSRLSFFTSASKETFGPGTDGVFIERPPRRAERFVMTLRNHRLTGLAPISRITHSRTPTTLLYSTLLFSSLLSQRLYRNGKRTWEDEIERRACARNIYDRNNSRHCIRLHFPWYISITDPSDRLPVYGF